MLKRGFSGIAPAVMLMGSLGGGPLKTNLFEVGIKRWRIVRFLFSAPRTCPPRNICQQLPQLPAGGHLGWQCLRQEQMTWRMTSSTASQGLARLRELGCGQLFWAGRFALPGANFAKLGVSTRNNPCEARS